MATTLTGSRLADSFQTGNRAGPQCPLGARDHLAARCGAAQRSPRPDRADLRTVGPGARSAEAHGRAPGRLSRTLLPRHVPLESISDRSRGRGRVRGRAAPRDTDRDRCGRVSAGEHPALREDRRADRSALRARGPDLSRHPGQPAGDILRVRLPGLFAPRLDRSGTTPGEPRCTFARWRSSAKPRFRSSQPRWRPRSAAWSRRTSQASTTCP